MRIDFDYGVFKWRASLMAIMILTLPAMAQRRNDHAFAVVPPQHRASLIQSTRDFIECEKTKQYGKLYQMLDDQEASRANQEDYVAARVKAETKHGVLREFAPNLVMDVTLNDSAPVTYEITGNARIKLGSHVIEKRMSMTAKLQGGIWKFSELSYSFLHEQYSQTSGSQTMKKYLIIVEQTDTGSP